MAKSTPTTNTTINHGSSVGTDAIDGKLRVVYKIMAFHCAYMLVWTIASNFFHHRFPVMEATMSGKGFVPYKLLSKYDGHSLVYAAHISPAMFWVGCIPVQFHPRVRKRYPKLHRYLGRAFIGTSCLMMVGVVVILRRRLLWEHYVNKENSANETDPFVIYTIPGTNVSYSDVSQGVPMAFFLCTAWNAVAHAKNKDYFRHQIWTIRHCGWGLWVVSQRILIGTVFLPVCMAIYGIDGEFGGRGRYYLFFWSGIAGMVVSVGTAEYAIRLLRRRKRWHEEEEEQQKTPPQQPIKQQESK